MAVSGTKLVHTRLYKLQLLATLLAPSNFSRTKLLAVDLREYLVPGRSDR